MEITLDCIPCMLRQALEASRMVTDDVAIQGQIMKEALKMALQFETYRNSPDMAMHIHHVIKEITGIEDAYFEVKQRDLKAAQEMYPVLIDFMNQQDNKIYWALKTAATGNNIDAAIVQNVDVKLCVQNELSKVFAISDLDLFCEQMENAKTVLIIGDNSGETVFDKVLIEHLKNKKIYYAVREAPILNDATKEEAIESGIHKVAEVISSGSSAPGTILEECNAHFLEIFEEADIIISKGQGNYEGLSESKRGIFFLLKAKCNMIAQKLEVPLNSYVFKYGHREQGEWRK